MPPIADPLAEYRDRIPQLTEEALDNIPDELKSLSQWVAWRLEHRAGNVTKVPIDPTNGNPASATDPITWGTLAQAVKGLVRYFCDGIGFVFTADDPFCGIDFDVCRNPETQVIKPSVENFVKALCSYAEISPSGTGVHIICKGSLPPKGRRKRNVEMYESGRYFTMTGDRLNGNRVEERSTGLLTLHRSLFGDRSTPPKSAATQRATIEDDDLTERAMSARNGEKFRRLWEGHWEGYPSRSEADLALCSLLAFWTQDPEQIDRLFRQSGLTRKKWEKRADYRRGTIEKALGEDVGRDDKAPNRHGGRVASHGTELNPADPLPSARHLLTARFEHEGQPTLVFQHGSFFWWDGITFRKAEDDEMVRKTRLYLEGAVRRDQFGRLVPFMPTCHKVREVLAALESVVLLKRDFAPPCWLCQVVEVTANPRHNMPNPVPVQQAQITFLQSAKARSRSRR